MCGCNGKINREREKGGERERKEFMFHSCLETILHERLNDVYSAKCESRKTFTYKLIHETWDLRKANRAKLVTPKLSCSQLFYP